MMNKVYLVGLPKIQESDITPGTWAPPKFMGFSFPTTSEGKNKKAKNEHIIDRENLF